MKNEKIEFGVKNFNNTQLNHLGKIKVLKANNIKYHEIIGDYTKDNIIHNIKVSPWFRYSRDSITPRNLKTIINYQTKTEIEKNLSDIGLSCKYSTAFYCLFYSSINKLMIRIYKDILGAD